MKITITFLLYLFVSHFSYAQKIDYKFDTNIRYQVDESILKDKYANEICVLDVYYPTNKPEFATLIWFHGGGLSGGEKDLPEGLKDKGFAVVSVGYRLAPKVKCPVYLQDAAVSVSWVFKNIGRYGGDSSKIFVGGYSAGAYLACMLGLDKSWLASYAIDANRFAGILACSPQVITHFQIRKERGLADTKIVVDAYAPLNHARKDASPMVLITGDRELELLGRYEENAYFLRIMKLTGNTTSQLFELGGYSHDLVYPACPIVVRELTRLVNLKNKK